MTVRRLAAILAADVAGYSRLMGVDEAGTLARLKLLRSDHVEPGLRRHNGRLVGEAGDSLLVEFASAVDAVTCAAELQDKLAVLNADLPEERRMRFRMGINLGEIIADGATIHGDGVNVAARLEKLAEPGSIAIARVVHDQIKGKVPFGFEDLGEQTLRNIAEPIRVFRISAAPAPARTERRDERTTVAVLPFTNMSGDPEQDYFSDGITEDLITALARFRRLSVIARNSTFQYKGRPVKIQDAGRELGARYVVEGSVRKGGNRVRVTAQLIDAESGAHVWAERFDRDLADIFAVQDELVMSIVTRLNYTIDDAVAEEGKRTSSDPSAYELFLRSRSAWRRGDELEARGLLERAIAIDSGFAPALANLAFYYAYGLFSGSTGWSEERMIEETVSYAERALAAGEGDPLVHHEIGVAFILIGDAARSRRHIELAHAMNPQDAENLVALGWVRAFGGEHREGLALIERALWLEPRMPPAYRSTLFAVLALAGEYEKAVAAFETLVHPPTEMYLDYAVCLARLGRDRDMARAIAKFEAMKPPAFDTAAYVRAGERLFARNEDRERMREGFRKAGLIP